jgi:5-phospho-D-xylono-1,4-lactonase
VIDTVLGPVDRLPDGIIDAHAHVWIDGVEGTSSGATFVLADGPAITEELRAFRAVGGVAAIDCMPGAAGRNLGRLADVSATSGVAIIGATGFHLPQYYAPGHPLNPWELPASASRERFERELSEGVAVAGSERRIRPGIVKAAHPGDVDAPGFRDLFVAALAAARGAGVPIMVHTERGEDVERLTVLITTAGIDPLRVVLAHIDKRPEPNVHASLAREGYLLEYDTFLRPKYDPDGRVWPLLEQLLADGLEDSIACALDLADPTMWAFAGGEHGVPGLATNVAARLADIGASPEIIGKLTGGNISRRLIRGTGR